MKQWKDLYVEVVELQNKIKSREKELIGNYTEELKGLVEKINNHKMNLIKQLNDQDIEATEENSLTELIQMIEEIEGGGVPDYDFLANIEEINKEEMKIGDYVFKTDQGEGMSGEFPLFRNLKELGYTSFSHSNFIGEFPLLPNITIINGHALDKSNFTGKFPPLPNIEELGGHAFKNSNFTETFPTLNSLKEVHISTFENSKFTGEFPMMENLKFIKIWAFKNSNFDKDGDGFVKNYPGWDGVSPWYKPSTYRASMADQIPPKLMTIITPGAGSLEVYDDIQGERVKKYLEENEPSDIDYYLEYTQKLRDIGFERDEFGNYVDMVNDKSVIIIPEDIKFLV